MSEHLSTHARIYSFRNEIYLLKNNKPKTCLQKYHIRKYLCFPKQKIFSRSGIVLHIFQIFLISGLIEDR